MRTSTPGLQFHSLVYSRILNVLIVLQLLIVSIGWLQLHSLREQHTQLLHTKAGVARARIYLGQIDECIRQARALHPDGTPLSTLREREIDQQLSEATLGLATAPRILDEDGSERARTESQTFANLLHSDAKAAALNDALSEAATSLAQWQAVLKNAVIDYDRGGQRLERAYLSVEAAFGLLPVMIAFSGVCAAMLKRGERRQAREREKVEAELREERGLLEKRIEARTAELQAEVRERKRAEQLNLGRNLLLEMVAREETQQQIFKTLTDVIVSDRSRWCCALHLVGKATEKPGELSLHSHSGLPASLLRNLQNVTVRMEDAPEAAALRNRRMVVLADLSTERKPWPQLLRANGIQSLWSVPIFAPDATPLGTLTVYSLLLGKPNAADVSLLESHAQMASMVLERYRLRDELRQHAYHDSLTGLSNRLLGEEQLSSAIRRSRRSNQSMAVLWIDLDKFKQTNDVHGHVAGDVVLKEVAGRLARRCRESDCVARMGGDEFMAVLEGLQDRSDAERVARELLAELAQPIAFQGLMLTVAASVGISMFPEDGETAEELQRNADMAMYEAKFGGHGVRVFSAALDHALIERRELERAMTHAIEHGGFVLHYQPQYGRDGRLEGFEALLRFPHPTLGMISPAQLIPIAEESQMIVALGNWVLSEACRQGRRWQEEGYDPVRISVNVSAIHFALPNFAEQVADALEHSQFPAAWLELELTESVTVKDFAESARQLQRLKKLGVSIALDDFGTGYSSLNQLHRLPIDRLKIDRSFILAMNEESGSLPIIESIIAMAHRMGAQVVGEGVETAEQLQLLCNLHCDSFQGYLLSRPIEPDRAAMLLEEGKSDHFGSEPAPILRAISDIMISMGEMAGA